MDETNGSFSAIGESSPSSTPSNNSSGTGSGSSTSCFPVTGSGGAGGRSLGNARALGLGRASPLSSGIYVNFFFSLVRKKSNILEV